MNNKYNSPYSASVTGCGYMLDEMNNILPLLMSSEQDALLKKEIIENKYLMIGNYIQSYSLKPLKSYKFSN